MNEKSEELDLLTQQFIVHRWHTTLGREVRDRIENALRKSEEISPILADYILEHPANVESYEFPYYPPDAMSAQDFWVLADDDLRGIQFYEEDFSNTTSFVKLNLSYSLFSRCNLSNINFDLIDFSYADFSSCDFRQSVIANSTACCAKLASCEFAHAIILNSYLKCVDFSGSDLRRVYFEDVKLRRIEVDYQTRFDKKLRRRWHDRSIELNQLPDLYRSIRLAYEKEELNAQTDHYLMRERVAHRKYLMWPRARESFSLSKYYYWFLDLMWSTIAGYGTKPARTVLVGIVVSLVFSLLYYYAGTPSEPSGVETSFLSALYFSFTTFATLGYGDLSYAHDRPYMRLLSTVEAWLGAVMIALFVVVVARKIIRR